MCQRDSIKNAFIEIDVSEKGKDESVRVTFVEEGYTKTPCLRIQIREHGRPLRMGPEIPVEYAEDLIQSLRMLIEEHKKTREE